MSLLKFGIIGCGRIAQRHAEHIHKAGQLIAVCDIEEKKAVELGNKYGATPYKLVKDMLAAHPDLDVVAVCSPNGLHASHSIQALKAGHHVLCEKPMALSVQDCGDMINTWRRSPTGGFSSSSRTVSNPPVAAVKQIVEEGRLGKIYSVQLNCFWNRNDEYYRNSWKGTRDLDGGTLFTQFSHFIDLLYWIVGDVREVHAFTGNFHHQGIIEFEDTGCISLRFYNGAIGTINYTVNSFGKNMEAPFTDGLRGKGDGQDRGSIPQRAGISKRSTATRSGICLGEPAQQLRTVS